jgi:hypothetical protein
MRDHLLDLVQHTYGLGVINLIKITGTETETNISAFDKETKTVVLNAQFKNPVPDFVGTFGMPNLDRLSTILNIPEYRDDAKISVSKQTNDDGTVVPSGVDFVNKNGDFKNNYRFMGEKIINEQLKTAIMRGGIKWNVEVTPTAQSIQKLKFQAMAHSDATSFAIKTDGQDLKIYFGDPSSHAGSFTFVAGCGGTCKQMHLPVSVVNNILSLPGDKTFKISDEGVAEITVDSGIAVYQYKLPSQAK